MMFIGILGIIVLVYLLLRTDVFKRQSANSRQDEDDALSILRKRFATGELSEEEFHRMKDELQK